MLADCEFDLEMTFQMTAEEHDSFEMEIKEAPLALPDITDSMEKPVDPHGEKKERRKSVSVNQTSSSRWQWIVLVAVCCVLVANASVPQSYGTLMIKLRESSGHTNFQLSWIGVIPSAVSYMSVPLCIYMLKSHARFYQAIAVFSFVLLFLSCILSSLVNHPAVLLLTFSLLYGFGSCLILSICLLLLADYFPQKHPRHVLGTSLYQIAYPLAAAVFSPILGALIDSHRWRNAIRMLGVILLSLGGLASFALRPQSKRINQKNTVSSVMITDTSMSHAYMSEPKLPQNGNHRPISQTSTISTATTNSSILQTLIAVVPFFTWKEVRQRPQIGLWFIAKSLNYLCCFSLAMNFKEYMIWRGYSQQRASNLLAAYTVGEICCALISSAIGHLFLSRLLMLHIITCCSMMLLCLFWRLLTLSYEVSLFLSAFSGVFIQLSMSFTYPAAVEVTQLPVHTSIATSMTAGGFGILFTPFLSQGNHAVIFYLMSALWFVQSALHSASLALCTYRYRRCQGSQVAVSNHGQTYQSLR